jgi:hypothetical protein
MPSLLTNMGCNGTLEIIMWGLPNCKTATERSAPSEYILLKLEINDVAVTLMLLNLTRETKKTAFDLKNETLGIQLNQ